MGASSDIKERKNEAKKKLKEFTKLKADYKASCVKINEIQEKWNVLIEESHSWRLREDNTRLEIKEQGELLNTTKEGYNFLKGEHDLLLASHQQLETECSNFVEENNMWKNENEQALLI